MADEGGEGEGWVQVGARRNKRPAKANSAQHQQQPASGGIGGHGPSAAAQPQRDGKHQQQQQAQAGKRKAPAKGGQIKGASGSAGGGAGGAGAATAPAKMAVVLGSEADFPSLSASGETRKDKGPNTAVALPAGGARNSSAAGKKDTSSSGGAKQHARGHAQPAASGGRGPSGSGQRSNQQQQQQQARPALPPRLANANTSGGFRAAVARPAATLAASATAARPRPTPGPKAVAVQQVAPPKKPKTGQHIELSLFDLVKVTPARSKVRAPVAVQQRAVAAHKSKTVAKAAAMPVNILDSRAPLQRRGKERERPKKKKPSTMRKIILKDRTRRAAVRAEAKQAKATPTEPKPSAATEAEGEAGADEWEDMPAEQAQDEDGELPGKTGATASEGSDGQKKKRRRRKAKKDAGAAAAADATGGLVETEQGKGAVAEQGQGPNGKKKRKRNKGKKQDGPGEDPSAACSAAVPAVDEQLAARRVRDYDYFRGTTTHHETCRYRNVAAKHGRNLRGYVDQNMEVGLNAACKALLDSLVTFQVRKMQQDPVKAATRRRYFMGLNEVHKAVQRGQAKCVIVPPDMEDVQMDGGLNDKLRDMVRLCAARNVTVVYALSRRNLGRALRIKRPTTVVAIQDPSGANDAYNRMLELARLGRENYRRDIDAHHQPCPGNCLDALTAHDVTLNDAASIKPRGVHEVVVAVFAGAHIEYSYSTHMGDIRFGIALRKSTGEAVELLEPHRSHEDAGTIDCKTDGECVFRFDNSISTTHSRGVTYSLSVKYPNGLPAHVIAQQAAAAGSTQEQAQPPCDGSETQEPEKQ